LEEKLCISNRAQIVPLEPLLAILYTPSVPNYRTSQESWRVKTIASLTKIIEINIKIYDIKLRYYENITNKESNGT